MFAAIVVGRLYQPNNQLEADLEVLRNFCDHGDICCLYDEEYTDEREQVILGLRTNQEIIHYLRTLAEQSVQQRS